MSCINALCRPQNTGTWLGTVYSISSFAYVFVPSLGVLLLTRELHGRTLIGNPSSEVILARYQSNGLVAFLAAVLFSGMISAAALRWLHQGRRWIFKTRV